MSDFIKILKCSTVERRFLEFRTSFDQPSDGGVAEEKNFDLNLFWNARYFVWKEIQRLQASPRAAIYGMQKYVSK